METTDEMERSETYTIRPPVEEKFNSIVVKEILRSIVIEELDGKKYHSFDPNEMVDHLAKVILEQLKKLPYKRYKYLLSITISEQKGQAMRYSTSYYWDPDTDDVASAVLITVYCKENWRSGNEKNHDGPSEE